MLLRNETAMQENSDGETRIEGPRHYGKPDNKLGHLPTGKGMLRNAKVEADTCNILAMASRPRAPLQSGSDRWAYGFQLIPVQCPNCSHVTWMSHPQKKQPCSRVCREDLGMIPKKRVPEFLHKFPAGAVRAARNEAYWRYENTEMELRREQWV